MKKPPSYDNTLPDSPLQRRQYEAYIRALCGLWVRRLSKRLAFTAAETREALRVTSRLAMRVARDRSIPNPSASTPAQDVAHVVHRFVTDVTPYRYQRPGSAFDSDEASAASSLRAIYADPSYSRAIVVTLAGFFRGGVLPGHGQHAA